MHIRTSFRAAMPAALALLAACAGAAGGSGSPAAPGLSREAVYLSPRPAPRENCGQAPVPMRLPALSELADSAALTAAIAAYAAQHRFDARRDSTYTLFSVAFGREGRVERVRGIEWWMPEGTVDPLAAIVSRHLKPQPGGGSVRLRVRPDAQPIIRVGRSQVCRPGSAMSFRLVAPQLDPLSKPQPILLRIRVSTDGRVVGAQVLRSSGEEELDRWVRSNVERYQYAPGLVDGVPVEMEYQQTVQIAARR
ncbi:MAG TPA: TonB family protein [Longimicrobiaceae bacterium]|jgi:TonB family protein